MKKNRFHSVFLLLCTLFFAQVQFQCTQPELPQSQNSSSARTSAIKPLPGKIECEAYDAMQGVMAEGTSDTGGGMDVAYIDDNDWMEFFVSVTAPSAFKVNIRVASPNSTGILEFRNSAGTTLAKVNVPNTGGWQTWTTISTSINLPAGEQNLRIHAPKGGWNINWIDLVSTTTTGTAVNVGGGSGDLTVDGSILGIKAGTTVTIAAGTYQSINLKNLIGTSSSPILVRTSGSVTVAGGSLNLSNVQYTTVSGEESSSTSTRNILVRDNTFRGTLLTNCPKGVTLKNIKYLNISDYSIFNMSSSTTYTGTDATTSLLDFKLLNIEFDNAGGVGLGGVFNSSTNTGFCKNLEIAGCIYKNRPDAGNVFTVGNVENYNIHHNTIDKINTLNNNHNGIFHLTGNGSFYNNKCTNHEGQLLRAWTFAHGSTVRNVSIYNNIVWNSRRYSAFEVQSFSSLVISGRTTYCNAKVFNNTAGKLDVEGTNFVGVLVDVYGLFGGTAEIFNNISYNQKNPGVNGGIYSQQANTKITVNKNNKYFTTATAAGLVDEVGFRLTSTSSAKKAGMASGLTTDYYNATRSTTPSIGGVE